MKRATGLGAGELADEAAAAAAAVGGALDGREGLTAGGVSSSELTMTGADLALALALGFTFPFGFGVSCMMKLIYIT